MGRGSRNRSQPDSMARNGDARGPKAHSQFCVRTANRGGSQLRSRATTVLAGGVCRSVAGVGIEFRACQRVGQDLRKHDDIDLMANSRVLAVARFWTCESTPTSPRGRETAPIFCAIAPFLE